MGEVVAFYGTGCRHHVTKPTRIRTRTRTRTRTQTRTRSRAFVPSYQVPANPSDCTRVSLDFRVGVEGHFDPHWSMRGTKADHCRAQVTL